jgi:thioredoxin 2
MVSAALGQLARDPAGKVKLVSVNAGVSPLVPQRFEAQAIPALLMLRGSRLAARPTGAASLPALRARAGKALARAAR